MTADLNCFELDIRATIFSAYVEVNHANWPAFQHFVRLITDPYIYINRIDLVPQNDVLNLLAGAINSDSNRFQCNELTVHLRGNGQTSITWTKNHVHCNCFCIDNEAGANQDEALLDFAVTGAPCTPSIKVYNYDLCKVAVDFVKKFIDLDNLEHYQGVQYIESFQIVKDEDLKVLKKDYAKFFVKEERDDGSGSTTYVFEFVNNAIGKKLQLTAMIYNDGYAWYSGFPLSMEIKNL